MGIARRGTISIFLIAIIIISGCAEQSAPEQPGNATNNEQQTPSEQPIKTSPTQEGNITISAGDYSIQRIFLKSDNPRIFSERAILEVTNYAINDGMIKIDSMGRYYAYNEPILPILKISERTLPDGTGINASFDKDASESTNIKNKVPIGNIAGPLGEMPGNFSYDGFYPQKLYRNYSLPKLGTQSKEIGINIFPVQYNSKTEETKIWTKMVFDISYTLPDSDVSFVNLSSDKAEYPANGKVTLNVSFMNKNSVRAVKLDVALADSSNSESIAKLSVGKPDLGNGISSAAYTINLEGVPASQIRGKTIMAELLVSDSNTGNLIASKAIFFKVI